ncbi:MAG: restriction endonuclease subunit S [Lacticaseibacillus paracasei]
MSKDAKNVPALRFKGYSDAWEKRKLLEISKTYSGLTYHPEDIRESGTFVIRSSNVQNGSIVTADDVYVSPDIVNSSNVLKGDVIVVVRNGSRNLIGKHALMIRDMPNTVIGAFMTGIRSAHGPFINALLSTKDFQSEVRKSLGATINQITIRDFKLMSFAVPNSQEVNSIGAIFGMLDNLIAATQHKIDALEQAKKALLQRLFDQSWRFKGYSDPWEKRKLGDYFPEILSGNRLPKSQIKSGPIPYVIATTRSNGIGGYVSKGQTDFSGNQMKLFKENSITVSIDNPEAIFLQQIPFVASNVMRILHNSDLTKNQLIVFLQILRSVTKGFNWSIKFSGPVIKNIEFTSPINLKELESIGAFLSSLDSLIAATQSRLSSLELLKKALLQDLFI